MVPRHAASNAMQPAPTDAAINQSTATRRLNAARQTGQAFPPAAPLRPGRLEPAAGRPPANRRRFQCIALRFASTSSLSSAVTCLARSAPCACAALSICCRCERSTSCACASSTTSLASAAFSACGQARRAGRRSVGRLLGCCAAGALRRWGAAGPLSLARLVAAAAAWPRNGCRSVHNVYSSAPFGTLQCPSAGHCGGRVQNSGGAPQCRGAAGKRGGWLAPHCLNHASPPFFIHN